MTVESPQFGADTGPAVVQRPAKRGARPQSEASWEAVSQADGSAVTALTWQTRAQLAEMAQQQQQSQQMMMTAMEKLGARLGQLEVQGKDQPTRSGKLTQQQGTATPTKEASPPGDAGGSSSQ